MYEQAAIKQNSLLRNGAYGIVMRGVPKCTCAGASLRGRKSAPLCCIKLDTATDGACGSGGMFVQSMRFVDEHKGNRLNVSIYGQELTDTTRRLAKMNLAIRGISANLGAEAANTFLNDQHKDLKADFSLENPPFNQKDWREANQLTDDPRWNGYPTPPTSNANYGWLLNTLSKLGQNGVGVVLLANGALSAGTEGNDEYEIRKRLIENDCVEAIVILPRSMFYTTDISVTAWILNRNKKSRIEKRPSGDVTFRDRSDEVLFMDLRQMGHPYEKNTLNSQRKTVQSSLTASNHGASRGIRRLTRIFRNSAMLPRKPKSSRRTISLSQAGTLSL